MRQFLVLLILGLCGCQLALPGRGGAPPEAASAAVAAHPITGDTIAVTPLDAPAPAPSAPVPAPPESAPQTDPPPAPPKTPSHLTCEAKGGRWSMAGSANASFCQTPTRDSGKSCRKNADCAGDCLAKSGTCAPYTPLFGCNEVLSDQGTVVTQCIN